MIQLRVYNDEVPNLELAIGFPNKKVQEIRHDDAKALDIARVIFAEYQSIDAPKGKFWRILHGHKFYADFFERDPGVIGVVQDYRLIDVYEPETTAFVEATVKEGDVCLDAGASVGYFTLLMARKAGKTGLVYSFEPTKNLFAYLKRNIDGNGYTNICQPHAQALHSGNGIISVSGNATGRDNVESITLDSLEIPRLDFIKMDIDGSEPEALKGMVKTIERSLNLKMVIEYYPKYIESLGNKPKDMMDFLDRYFTYERIKGDYGQGYWNYFCRRK